MGRLATVSMIDMRQLFITGVEVNGKDTCMRTMVNFICYN